MGNTRTGVRYSRTTTSEFAHPQRPPRSVCALGPDKVSFDWSLLVREMQRPDGLARLLQGQIIEKSKAAAKAR